MICAKMKRRLHCGWTFKKKVMEMHPIAQTTLMSMRVAINTQAQSDVLKATKSLASLLIKLTDTMPLQACRLTEAAAHLNRSQTMANARYEMIHTTKLLREFHKHSSMHDPVIIAIQQSMLAFPYIKG
jgi:hypothetical protein